MAMLDVPPTKTLDGVAVTSNVTSIAGLTVNDAPDVVDAGMSLFVTVIVPPAVAGTVKVIDVALFAVTTADVPATCTPGTELPKFVPVIVTLDPTHVERGVNEAIV